VASVPRAKEETKVAAAQPLRPGAEAAAQVLAQLDHGEQPHVGLLGDTGAGKTTAARELVRLYLQRSPGSVFILDDKELRARFDGNERRDRRDLKEHPIDPAGPNPRVVIFRGDPARGVMADPEEIAELAWRRVAKGKKTWLVIDELIAGREELSKNCQWRKGVTWVPRSFTMGRQPGVGTLWGAQSPQDVPKDPFEQSNAILCFRLAGLGLAKLQERDYLLGGADEVIPRLHAPPDPPEQRGDFVLLQRGRPWDGKIYKFSIGG
jgi:energy-coupling factor transporter ATP-binding protein EcfA2